MHKALDCFLENCVKPEVTAQVCNPSIQKGDEGESAVKGHPQPYREFEATLGYKGHCLMKKNKKGTHS